MEACAVICRKATVALPDANFLSSRAQNRHFCVRNGDISLVLALFKHKIGIFVRGFCILAEIFELGRGGARRSIGKSNN